MIENSLKGILFMSVGALSMAGQVTAGNDVRPNVLFILADDFGWNDLSCMGSTYYETPNLDRLAKRGVLFTNAYATCQVSSPSRASIMTGKYTPRPRSDRLDWSSFRRSLEKTGQRH